MSDVQLVTASIRADLVRRLDLYVLARRRADGPGTRLSRSAIVREIVEPVLERLELPADLAARLNGEARW
jgi:hypothetical protein